MKKLTINLALALAVVLMITSLTIYVLPLFGWRVDDIGSGSMEPEFNAGTMVISQRVNPASITVGDIIIFRSSSAENMICHRVFEVRRAGLEFVTKGDAYKDPDPAPVADGNVVGRITFHASFIGNIVAFIKTLPGLIIFLVLPGLFITGFFLKAIWRELVIYIRKTG
jgi:signal peptidase